MKKLLLVSVLLFTGLVNAKENNSAKLELKKQKLQDSAFTRYLVTIKTICGTMHQTIFDSEFDSSDCLYNEWEIYNHEDCGHASYENPMI